MLKFIALAVLGSTLAAVLAFGDRDRERSGPLVTQAILDRALAEHPSVAEAASDEIRFYTARRDARGGEDLLADRRILAASLARFQGYGDPADLNRALVLLDSLLVQRHDDAALWSAKASVDLARHRFRSAVHAAERAVRLSPGADGSSTRLRLFDTYLAAGRYDEARRLLSLPHDRNALQYRVREARLADRLGDVASARNIMTDVVEMTRAYAQPRLVQAWALVELGHFEHHSGNPAAALHRFLGALEVAPAYPAALEGLAGLAYGVDRNGAAAEALYAAAYRNGGHADLLATLAEVAQYRGEPDRAAAYLDQLLELASADTTARRWVSRPAALSLAGSGHPDRALEFAELDLRERPTAESWAVFAWVTHRLGRTDVAATMFRRALEWGTPEPMVFYLAGTAAAERGDRRQARRLLGVAAQAEAELGPVKSGSVRRLLAS